MFDIGGVEILVLAVVAILVVGPKDLPSMLRTLGRYVRQAKSMIGDMQSQFQDALEESDLHEMKETIDEMRSLDPRHRLKAHFHEHLKPLSAGDAKNASSASLDKSDAKTSNDHNKKKGIKKKPSKSIKAEDAHE